MIVEMAFGGDGDEAAGRLGIGLALLGGAPRFAVGGPVESAGRDWGAHLWRGDGWVAGFVRSKPGFDIEDATIQAYAGILRASRGMNLYRIWNCVPRINGTEPGGIENYHAFCRGRSRTFEAEFGKGFSRSLPAASAVGTAGDELAVTFLAGAAAPRHFENPAQVPAYEYPLEHGPRPPSFARATAVDSGAGQDVFVSGTSAVVGHETVAPNDTLAQLDCTFENLRLISRACGLGDRLGSGQACRRHFIVYLRHAADLAAVEERVGTSLLSPGDRVSYLRADICRAALNVEVEVSVRGADRI
jgi:chorismate lyase/3-hydroxybenzoate synthase